MDKLCLHCGYEGRPKKILKGSRKTEIIMWTVLLVPGPFYTAWRMLTKKLLCPNCKSPGMKRMSSRKAKAYLLEMETELLTHQNERALKLVEEQKALFVAAQKKREDPASEKPVAAAQPPAHDF